MHEFMCGCIISFVGYSIVPANNYMKDMGISSLRVIPYLPAIILLLCFRTEVFRNYEFQDFLISVIDLNMMKLEDVMF